MPDMLDMLDMLDMPDMLDMLDMPDSYDTSLDIFYTFSNSFLFLSYNLELALDI